jgi:TIR domain
MSGQIFICYRRDDSSAAAGRLYDRLLARLPNNHIFFDVDLDPGIDFVEAIETSVGSCDVLIAVIGNEWLLSSDERGKRRLDNPDDFVRLEIATALKRNIRVIPVLVDGASMPRSGDLPDDLKVLARRNALEVSHNRFNADSERLVAAIERVLEKADAGQMQCEETPMATFDAVARTANEIRESMRKEPDDADAFLRRGMPNALCVSSDFNVQEAPILKIEDLKIENQLTAEKGPHFILSFMIANVGNVVCQTHLVTIRIPLKFGSTPVVIDDEQPPLNGRVSEYVDTESQSTAYVLKISGGKIYSGDKVTKAVRIMAGARFDDRMNAFCSRTENKVSITFLSDPPTGVKVEAQLPL